MDFLNPNAKYELLVNNVPRVDFATGGLLQNSPIVCGGEDDNYSISLLTFLPLLSSQTPSRLRLPPLLCR